MNQIGYTSLLLGMVLSLYAVFALGVQRLLPDLPPPVVLPKPVATPAPIDLTARHDDLWDRIRNGFAMPNLENELVRRRYDTLNLSFLAFLEQVIARCDELIPPHMRASTQTPDACRFLVPDNGLELDAFFDVWLYQPGKPVLNINTDSVDPVIQRANIYHIIFDGR